MYIISLPRELYNNIIMLESIEHTENAVYISFSAAQGYNKIQRRLIVVHNNRKSANSAVHMYDHPLAISWICH